MKWVTAGELRHRITIQQSTQTHNEFGEPIAAWADEFSMAASVEPLTGKELLQAQQMESSVTHKIRTRYRAGVTTKKRIKFRNGCGSEGDRIFNIDAVINVEEKNRELQIMAIEEV